MSDQTWMWLICLDRCVEEVKTVIDHGGDLEEQPLQDGLVRLIFHDIDGGGEESFDALAETQMPIYGRHGAGDNYAAHLFVICKGRTHEVDCVDAFPVVRYERDYGGKYRQCALSRQAYNEFIKAENYVLSVFGLSTKKEKPWAIPAMSS